MTGTGSIEQPLVPRSHRADVVAGERQAVLRRGRARRRRQEAARRVERVRATLQQAA